MRCAILDQIRVARPQGSRIGVRCGCLNMPRPGEHKTVQARILQYAQDIGWTYVPRKHRAGAGSIPTSQQLRSEQGFAGNPDSSGAAGTSARARMRSTACSPTHRRRIITFPDLAAMTTTLGRLILLVRRPTTRAAGRTVPARTAAAAPEHRCAAARRQVPRHSRPAARRTPAHKRARALRKPSARPPADRESGAATTGAGGAYGSAGAT